MRYLVLGAALILTVIVLYLPAAHPPERFVAQLRQEHAINVAYWGVDPAHQILDRMLDWKAALGDASIAKTELKVQAVTDALSPVDRAVAGEMAKAANKLWHNAYFRSVETLMTLALYRVSVLMQWWPVGVLLAFALLFDGFVVRIVRSREFVQLNPEMFGLCLLVLIMTLSATLIAVVLPVTLHPLTLFVAVVVASLASRGIVANYHRRA
ncbi:DUF4400 domain-containing protein [Actimicrobium sp. CCI2.3]|uniref:DUF4400 domain-containing protein n=1 Tax=Actimicrobium sp. CCI2.3 TaxID=3048616 RepID=UPI002AB4A03B|nr:DUF4400 domain-containing protein [Actimicrobium sp. CCI2.3]MDY7574432.1 DUF4400 domain-containing protein [Actimicrobium sp. CCI2.3]MEB0022490.1 DUF4400 domain-containing protein [Actimicrobium sp. CCI2.3]